MGLSDVAIAEFDESMSVFANVLAEQESRQQAEGAAAANQADAQRIVDFEARLAEKEAKTRGDQGVIEKLQGQLAKADADKQVCILHMHNIAC